jgi:hypothetical protein
MLCVSCFLATSKGARPNVLGVDGWQLRVSHTPAGVRKVDPIAISEAKRIGRAHELDLPQDRTQQ